MCNSEERWEAFKQRYKGVQSLEWLKKSPLGNIHIYSSVFHGEAPAASGIQSLSDVEDALGESINISSSKEEDTQKGRKRKRGPDADLDSNPQVPPEMQAFRSHEQEVRELSVSKSKKKKSKTEDDAIVLTADKLVDAAAIFSKEPGSSDLTSAIADFEDHFQEGYSKDEAFVCIERLCEGRNAVIWNALKGAAMKKHFLSKWLSR